MIKVSEVFYSLQGEGHSMGKPSVFIRMPGCNLRCQGEYWKCDSLDLRNVFTEYTVESLWRKVLSFNVNMREYLRSGRARIIFTGGEPGLENNSKMINAFLDGVPPDVVSVEERGNGYVPTEIETNGSLSLNEEYRKLLSRVSVVNCSPKLESSGNDLDLRYNRETLKFIENRSVSLFKFVVSDVKDLTEVMTMYDFVNPASIILMPATQNVSGSEEKDNEWQRYIWETAAEKGWRYSGREHINVWGLRAGV